MLKEEINKERLKIEAHKKNLTLEKMYELIGISRQHVHSRLKKDGDRRDHWVYLEICNFVNNYTPKKYHPIYRQK